MFDIVFTHYDPVAQQITGEVRVRGPFVNVFVWADRLVGHYTQPKTEQERRTGGRVIASLISLTKGPYWTVELANGEKKCYTGWGLEIHEPLERNRSVKRRTILVEDTNV